MTKHTTHTRVSFTVSWSFLKVMSIKSVMPLNHLILCHPVLLLPSIFPSIRVFSSESALHIRWPKYWSFYFRMKGVLSALFIRKSIHLKERYWNNIASHFHVGYRNLNEFNVFETGELRRINTNLLLTQRTMKVEL